MPPLLLQQEALIEHIEGPMLPSLVEKPLALGNGSMQGSHGDRPERSP
ncbi:hypothetical protein AAG587_17535 [Vreelandella neptunia]